MNGSDAAAGVPDEVLREFLSEGLEIVAKLDRDLVSLEQAPRDRELLASVFRGVHTIKGNSGFLGFQGLQAITHAGETLLSRLRDGELLLSRETATALLAMGDALRKRLQSIEQGGTDVSADDPGTRALVSSLLKGGAAPDSETKTVDHAHAESRIRVDVGLLDRLMTLVGELVLARNRILQLTDANRDGIFAVAAQRLATVTTELQEGVMKARMQPVGQLWNRFPRVVRDLALACGKPVALALEGENTELDRSVLEAIADPLLHMLRNAVDHGIESPSARAVAGKPAEGRILLRAFHDGGQIILEVSDDGAGMDPARLKRKAVEAGLLSSEQVSRLDDREALDLVFLPGFSTAAEVTTLSGRGVGMDVVRTNLQSIGGSVEIQTRSGAGTLFRLKIPLTLAIIPALVVSAAGERFAIPQVHLLELVRVENAETAFETLHSVMVYRLRGQLLPLVFLGELLGLEPSAGRRKGPAIVVVLQAGDSFFGLAVDAVQDTAEIVVKPLGRHLKDLRVYAGATILGDGRVALILDVPGVAQQAHVSAGDRDRARSAAKAVPHAEPERMRQALILIRGAAGARMALPLERVARLEEFPRSSIERALGRDVVQYRGEILPLIEVSSALPERRRGPRPAGEAPPPEEEVSDTIQVVVVSSGSRRAGLIVDRVLDVVEEDLSQARPASREGVLCCAVIRERVTELLDVDAVARAAFDSLAMVGRDR